MIKMNISTLNQYCQMYKLSLPEYHTAEVSGADHSPTFTVCCNFNDRKFYGSALSKRAAKDKAAEKAVSELKIDLDKQVKVYKLVSVEDEVNGCPVDWKDVWDGDLSRLVLTLCYKKSDHEQSFKRLTMVVEDNHLKASTVDIK